MHESYDEEIFFLGREAAIYCTTRACAELATVFNPEIAPSMFCHASDLKNIRWVNLI